MASRVLHYLIADLVSKAIDVKDFNRFAVGSLAPDISSHEDGSYDIAHFGRTNESKRIKGIKWTDFAQKYKKEVLTDDLYLGYYTHLITDAIWFKNIANKYIRIYPKAEQKPYLQKGYRDYLKLNALFIKKYKLTDSIQWIDEIHIDEIKKQYISTVHHLFQEDFKCELYDDDSLELYKIEDIHAFVDFCVERAVHEIKMLLTNGAQGDPEEFYAKLV